MIKKQFGKTTKEKLKASARDKLYNFLIADGNIRGAMVHSTKMINEMRTSFNLGILETLALGHAYIGACLMSATLKGNDQISMRIQCSGPIKGLSVEANALGEVRGFLKQNPIPITKPPEKLDLSPFFGAGFLSVSKHLEDAKHPFTGQVILEYGSIAKDLANYYLTSEQTPSSFSISIQFDSKGDVVGAGGLMTQAMPGVKDADLAEIEKILTSFPSIGSEFAKENTPENLINKNFNPFSPRILGNHRVEFFCRCDEKRILDYIGVLPMSDLEEIIENGPFPVETKCHNCNTLYRFSKEQIEKKYKSRKNSH